MENASKALIIAGSVLISILLISVGIIILNSTTGITDEAGNASKTMAASMFNSRFTQYFGTSVSSTQVKSFISTIIANNSMPENHQILLNFNNKDGSHVNVDGKSLAHISSVSDIQKVLSNISVSSKYTIRITYGCGTYAGGYDNGYVSCLTIQKN